MIDYLSIVSYAVLGNTNPSHLWHRPYQFGLYSKPSAVVSLTAVQESVHNK